MSYETTAFTFWKGVSNKEELLAYVQEHGDCPECEMFAELQEDKEDLIKGQGYIAEEPTDQEIIAQIPKTLREALGKEVTNA